MNNEKLYNIINTEGGKNMSSRELKERAKMFKTFCAPAREHFRPDIVLLNQQLKKKGLGKYGVKI